MIKTSVDARIREDSMDTLRRSLYEAKEHIAEERGYVRGHGEGYSEALQEGYNRAIEDMLSIILDFAKGNRS